MRHSCLHLVTKRHLFIFKHDEVIGILAQQNVCITCHSRISLFERKSGVRLYFDDEKVDAAYYVGLLPQKVLEVCNQLLPGGFIFQRALALDGQCIWHSSHRNSFTLLSRIYQKVSVAFKVAGPKPVFLPDI